MAAKASKSKQSEPQLVRVSPRWIKFGALLSVAFLVLAGLWQIEKHNRRVQAERNLLESPALAKWLRGMKAEIDRSSAMPRNTRGERRRLAEAVWIGTLAERRMNNPNRRSPELDEVVLRPAWLIAGQRGPQDPTSGKVSISVKNFAFPGGEPQKGESWAFAVERINEGYNAVRDACRIR